MIPLKKIIYVKYLGLVLLSGLLSTCTDSEPELTPANIDHGLYLIDSTELESGEILKWIAIYADAPSYEHIVDSDEGATCVDDVGRFMEVIEFEINKQNRKELLPLAEGMVKYLLHLSREDGLWYNFLFPDGSINTSHENSLPEFSWWAVRGLRGLGAGYRIFANRSDYDELAERISSRFMKSQPHLDTLFSTYPEMSMADDGSMRPSWNLSKAPDQSAELLMALAGVHGLGDFSYDKEIQYLAEALMGWQYTGDDLKYKGLYYCWQNTWHGWGNNQAFALLQAYIISADQRYLNSVKLWADHFVPTLIELNFPAEFKLDSTGVWHSKDFSQIAYGMNSTYRGINLLAAVTGNPEYKTLSEKVFAWFKGENIASTQMYDPVSGRCFDGINSIDKVNHNSGAESTIECLLAIQARGGW